jgi:hypothetical protein
MSHVVSLRPVHSILYQVAEYCIVPPKLSGGIPKLPYSNSSNGILKSPKSNPCVTPVGNMKSVSMILEAGGRVEVSSLRSYRELTLLDSPGCCSSTSRSRSDKVLEILFTPFSIQHSAPGAQLTTHSGILFKLLTAISVSRALRSVAQCC